MLVTSDMSSTLHSPLTNAKTTSLVITLGGVLSPSTEGTVAELTKAIKDHLAENPSRMNDGRFTGLFSSSKKRPIAVPGTTATVNSVNVTIRDGRITSGPQLPVIISNRMPHLPAAPYFQLDLITELCGPTACLTN